MEKVEFLDKGREWLLIQGPGLLVDLVVFILILVIGAIMVRVLRSVVKKMLQKSKRVSETLEKFVINVLGKVLWVVVLMIALPRLGIDIAPLVAGLGVTGFIIGFAFQESLGNLAAGLMIILNQPFAVGDFIEAGGHSGSVWEINMMATTMTTGDNKKVVIPNRTVWGGPVVNYSAMETRRVDLVIGISYDADIGKAQATINQILKDNTRVLDTPDPIIEVEEMADSSVNLVVRPWCKNADYWKVYFEVNRGVKEAFDREGIEIPFPQIDVHHHGTTKAS